MSMKITSVRLRSPAIWTAFPSKGDQVALISMKLRVKEGLCQIRSTSRLEEKKRRPGYRQKTAKRPHLRPSLGSSGWNLGDRPEGRGHRRSAGCWVRSCITPFLDREPTDWQLVRPSSDVPFRPREALAITQRASASPGAQAGGRWTVSPPSDR